MKFHKLTEFTVILNTDLIWQLRYCTFERVSASESHVLIFISILFSYTTYGEIN